LTLARVPWTISSHTSVPPRCSTIRPPGRSSGVLTSMIYTGPVTLIVELHTTRMADESGITRIPNVELARQLRGDALEPVAIEAPDLVSREQHDRSTGALARTPQPRLVAQHHAEHQRTG